VTTAPKTVSGAPAPKKSASAPLIRSDLPQSADISCARRHFGFVPGPDLSRCSKLPTATLASCGHATGSGFFSPVPISGKVGLKRVDLRQRHASETGSCFERQEVFSDSEMTGVVRNLTGIPEIGKFTLPAYSMLALSLVGIGVALYVAHGNYTGQTLWCPIIDGCNAVVNSPYSRVFGVPMSYFGFIYYLYMFALAVRLVFEPFSKSLRFRAILYSAMGAISSFYFMYLQLNFIREMCSYCLISAVASLLLLLAALWHFQATRHPAFKSAN
jgi:uncharacterized membrane protein